MASTNDFSKEERVAFEDILEGFNDELVLSAKVSKYRIGDVTAERAQDTMWRPQPYIMQSFDGLVPQDVDFSDVVQMSVPSTIGFKKSVPFELDATELRDGLQENRLVKGARQKLASDINVAVMNTASSQGTLNVSVATAATGYDDLALADAIMNEQGVNMNMRHCVLATRDYNLMAGNLAERQTMNDKVTKAYTKSYVGDIAGFDTNKLDYANRITASPGDTVTISGAGQNYTPRATDDSQAGQINVDNRYMTLNTASTTPLADGDAFTIADVEALHHITKLPTGQLKTFRVISGGGSNTLIISPPIITTDDTPTKADEQYANCDSTPADGAVITPLNIADTAINPFWHYDAIELLPARLVIPSTSGLADMHATTDQGIDVMMTRQGAINTLNVKYRLDVFFGTVMVAPEMAGQILFNQS